MGMTENEKPLLLTTLVSELKQWNTTPDDLAKAIVEVFQIKKIPLEALDLCGCLIRHAGYSELTKEQIRDILSRLNYNEKEIQYACQFMGPTEFEVNAKLPWQKTGIYIRPWNQIQIKHISGKWVFNPELQSCGPEGNRGLFAKYGYALPGSPEGALIGKVGEYKFNAGATNTICIDEEGELEFVINDDLDSGYGAGLRDNSGSIKVSIEFIINLLMKQ